VSPIFTPIVRISPLSENFAKKIGFEFTDYSLHQTSENWLVLYASWTAKDDFYYKVKYCADDGSMHGNRTETQMLCFPELKHNYYSGGKRFRTNFSIECGLSWNTGLTDLYRLSHFQPSKRDVSVYFSPRGFGKIQTKLTSWRNEEFWNNFGKNMEKCA